MKYIYLAFQSKRYAGLVEAAVDMALGLYVFTSAYSWLGPIGIVTGVPWFLLAHRQLQVVGMEEEIDQLQRAVVSMVNAKVIEVTFPPNENKNDNN